MKINITCPHCGCSIWADLEEAEGLICPECGEPLPYYGYYATQRAEGLEDESELIDEGFDEVLSDSEYDDELWDEVEDWEDEHYDDESEEEF